MEQRIADICGGWDDPLPEADTLENEESPDAAKNAKICATNMDLYRSFDKSRGQWCPNTKHETPDSPITGNWKARISYRQMLHSRQFIEVRIEDQYYPGMLEMDEAFSVLDTQMYDKFLSHVPLKPTRKKENRFRHWPANTRARQMRIRAAVEGWWRLCNFLVTDCPVPMMCGIDFQWNFQISCLLGQDTKTVSMNSEDVTSWTYFWNVGCVESARVAALQESAQIRANSVQTVWVKADSREFKDGQAVAIFPKRERNPDLPIEVANSVAYVVEGYIPVAIMNTRNRSVNLRHDEIAYSVEPLCDFSKPAKDCLFCAAELPACVAEISSVTVGNELGTEASESQEFQFACASCSRNLPEECVTLAGPAESAGDMAEVGAGREAVMRHLAQLVKKDLPLQEIYKLEYKNLPAAEKAGKLSEAQLLLSACQSVFAKQEDDLGVSQLMKHKVDVDGCRPIGQRPRRLPPGELQVANEELEKLSRADLAGPSCSPWASPIVIARRRDGSSRFFVDYRKLNDVTKRDD